MSSLTRNRIIAIHDICAPLEAEILVHRMLYESIQRFRGSRQSQSDCQKNRPAAGAELNNTEESGQLIRCGDLVCLRQHALSNRPRFQEWYADPEIAYLLRHDLKPLSERQSRSYFDAYILPLSSDGYCYAIHDKATSEFIGTTALTDTDDRDPATKLFRIVIGEKRFWSRGYGTDTTRLVAEHAFESLGLESIRLEVFQHNPRAITSYERVGFVRTSHRQEWIGPNRPSLDIIEMRLDKSDYYQNHPNARHSTHLQSRSD